MNTLKRAAYAPVEPEVFEQTMQDASTKQLQIIDEVSLAMQNKNTELKEKEDALDLLESQTFKILEMIQEHREAIQKTRRNARLSLY